MHAGYTGKKALARSKEVVQPVRLSLALPFVGFIILAKVADLIRLPIISLLPPRFIWELPEIPAVVFLGISLLSAILQRYPLAVH